MTNRINELRTARGLTQAAFAERIGVSRQTVSALESGKTEPGLGLAMRISWLFGCSVEDVFVADLEERMNALEATYAFTDRLATAFSEIGVLEKMGADGWELTSFGAGFLRFRRPDDASLRVSWQYRRLQGLMSNAERASNESERWTFCGSWMGVFHYFKRQTRDA